MTVQAAYQHLLMQLSSVYEPVEAGNIADWVMEHLTGFKKIDRIVHKQGDLSSEQSEKLEKYILELLQHRPVQYVVGEAWFAGMRFRVNEGVLIPRPETEELVELVSEGKRILDIGTGSGCIAIALKKKFPEAEVFACDVSEEALEIAGENAKANNKVIEFIQCDLLNKEGRNKLPKVDVIVSNPPYIPLADQSSMRKNVLKYEPHLALFVSNDKPLIFYEAIADFALAHLTYQGNIYLEIHESYGNEIKELFEVKGFSNVALQKDMQGKYRLVSGKLGTKVPE